MKSIFLLLVMSTLSACAQTTYKHEQSLDQPPVDFSGHWEIDHELTESPRDKIRWLYEVAKSQIEQQRRTQERNAVGRQNVSAINDLQAVIGLGTLAETISRVDILAIEQSQDAIVVKRKGDYALTCDFSEQGIRTNKLGSEYCIYDRGGQIVFAVALPEDLTLVNRLVMSADGSRLNIATTLASSDLSQKFTLNRVYMRYEPGPSAYKCKFTLKDKKTCWLGTE